MISLLHKFILCSSLRGVVTPEYLHRRDLMTAIWLKWEARGLILKLWITCHFYQIIWFFFFGVTGKGEGLKEIRRAKAHHAFPTTDLA